MAATTIPSPTSGSDVIQGHLISLSGMIPYDLWSYSLGMSPWANAIPRGEFKKGLGARQRTANFKRSLAGTTGKMTWANHSSLGFSSAATGNSPPDVSSTRSLMPTTVVQANQSLREFGLKNAAVESPRFDVRDAVLNWDFVDQFGQYYEKVKEAAGKAWEYEQREAYFNMCDNKVILGVPESGTPLNPMADLTVRAPTSFSTLTGYSLAQLNSTGGTVTGGFSDRHSTLNNGALQSIKAILDRGLAGKDKRLIGSNGTAYPLVCSPEQAFWLSHEPGIRADLRYADAGSLLKEFGKQSFLGFQHIEDPEVPRFTLALNGSVYDFTEVLPWTYQAGNLSTTFASAATYNSGAATEITTAASGTVGIVAGNVIRLAPTSASDDSYSGEFTVLAVTSTTTLVINKEWTDTATGNLYSSGNGEAGWVRNTSYDTAPYEMSFILLPGVMEVLTIDYPSTLGQGSQFESIKPLGSFSWKNIPNEDRNPDGTLGYFRGIFEYAARPKMTEYGWAIMHRRAEPFTLSSPSFSTVTSGLGWWS